MQQSSGGLSPRQLVRGVQELVLAEAKRERKRAALAAEVEVLREAADDEFRRRCELERALRDAAHLFKRELFEKSEEVAGLQDEVCAMRKWRIKSSAPADGASPPPAAPAAARTELLTAAAAGTWPHVPLAPPAQQQQHAAGYAGKAPPAPRRGAAAEAADFDAWHEELADRLDCAMRRLSPAPDP